MTLYERIGRLYVELEKAREAAEEAAAATEPPSVLEQIHGVGPSPDGSVKSEVQFGPPAFPEMSEPPSPQPPSDNHPGRMIDNVTETATGG